MRRMIAASVARRIALKKMGAGALALATPMQVLSAGQFDALALQVIQTLQPRLDSLPQGPQAAPADEDGDDYRPRP